MLLYPRHVLFEEAHLMHFGCVSSHLIRRVLQVPHAPLGWPGLTIAGISCRRVRTVILTRGADEHRMAGKGRKERCTSKRNETNQSGMLRPQRFRGEDVSARVPASAIRTGQCSCTCRERDRQRKGDAAKHASDLATLAVSVILIRRSNADPLLTCNSNEHHDNLYNPSWSSFST